MAVDGGARPWHIMAMTAAQPPRCPGHVLLVEDSPIIAMNTEELLRDMGVGDVSVAASVAQALALIDRLADDARFDLALLDFKLGDEDCLPIALRLARDGVPVVFVTGFGDELDLPVPLRDARILKKPYNYSALEGVLVPPDPARDA